MLNKKSKPRILIFCISIILALGFSNGALALGGSLPPLHLLSNELQEIYYPFKVLNYALVDDMTDLEAWQGITSGKNNTSVSQTSINGSFISMNKSYSIPLSINNYIVLQLEVSNPKGIDWLSLYLSSSEDFEDYFYIDLTSKLKAGANKLVINKSEFSIGGGSPSWSNLELIQVAFETKQTSSSTVKIEKIATHDATPLITVWFDDGWENTYTEAFSRMQQKEIKGIVSVIGSYVGLPGYCSINQLQSMDAHGWELVNHTYSHPNLAELSLEAAEMEISKGQEYLLRNGFIDSSLYFVPPYSSVSEEVNVIINKYALLNRKRPASYNSIPLINLSDIAFKEVTNTTTVETVKNWINEAIEHDLWLVLLFHRLEESTEWTTQYTPASFQEIIDYIHIKKDEINPVTITEALSSM